MSTDIAPIQKAGLMPTASHIAMFDDLLNEYSTLQSKSSLHETLRKFNEMAAVKGMSCAHNAGLNLYHFHVWILQSCF
jgi:hypothetical protein